MDVQKFIEQNRSYRLNIVVIGDTMIDDYKYGHVTRVSPEFPVQVLTSQYDKEEIYPGGAANVCYQMTHFNAEVYLVGFVDTPGAILYDSHQFNIASCIDLVEGRVPRKIRFYDGDFPLLRWDVEQPNYGENQVTLDELRQESLSKFIALLEAKPISAVIISDYDKGFWNDVLAQEVIGHCNKRGIISVVDPKKDLQRWKYCAIFKPNAKEAEAMVGSADWKTQVDYMQEKLVCKGVVITQSGKGVVGKYEKDYFEHWTPKKLSSKEVNSVIGAGDCFDAIMTLSLSHGLGLKESCEIAFEGGVQYVKARHNKPITPHDIFVQFDNVLAKIITLEELLYLKNNVYDKDEFVFTNGCFDLLHAGHLSTLRFAKHKGNKLIVGLNSDLSVEKLKGHGRPVKKWDERAELLAAVEYVDFVIGFEESTPEAIIKKIKPHYLVKGGDYPKETVIGSEYVKEVFIAPTIEGRSTTKLLEKVDVTPK